MTRYLDHKYYKNARLIPLNHGQKTPRDLAWQKQEYSHVDMSDWVAGGGNVGFIPGDKIVVADVDPRAQACASEHPKAKFEYCEGKWVCTSCGALGNDAYELAEAAGLDPAQAPTIQTGGNGLHLAYQMPPGVRIRRKDPKHQAIEYKTGHNTYLAAPPSIHPNGTPYERDDCSPDLVDAPPLPASVLERIERIPIDPAAAAEAAVWTPEQLQKVTVQMNPEALEDYHEGYLAMMMAAHHATGGHPEACEVMVEFFGRNPVYSDHDESVRLCWESIRGLEPGEIGWTARTIYKFALDADADLGFLDLDKLPDADDDETEMPTGAKDYQKAVKADRKRKLDSVVTLDHVKPKKVDWLVPYWIPAGMLTLFTGNPAVLKSTVAIDIVARITRGDPMPFCNKGTPPGDVLILACEDPVPEVVVPRLLVAGADMKRVHVRQAAWAIDQLDELGDMIKKYKPKLIYIDALFSALQNMDAHRDNEVRGPLISMTELAARYGTTILATRHTRKGGASLAIDAGMASRAFGAVARSEILFVSDPDATQGAGRFIMAHAKCNLKPRQRSQRYQAEEAEVPKLDGERSVRVSWQGESEYTADELASGTANQDGRPANQRLGAMGWLEDYLRDRGEPVPPGEAKADGAESGHSASTLQRAAIDSEFIVVEGRAQATRWTFVDPMIPGGE